MAAVDLCTFNHGLGIYILILSLAGAREKFFEYKSPTHGFSNINPQPGFPPLRYEWLNIFIKKNILLYL